MRRSHHHAAPDAAHEDARDRAARPEGEIRRRAAATSSPIDRVGSAGRITACMTRSSIPGRTRGQRRPPRCRGVVARPPARGVNRPYPGAMADERVTAILSRTTSRRRSRGTGGSASRFARSSRTNRRRISRLLVTVWSCGSSGGRGAVARAARVHRDDHLYPGSVDAVFEGVSASTSSPAGAGGCDWGARELGLLDPNGYYLTFTAPAGRTDGRRLEEASRPAVGIEVHLHERGVRPGRASAACRRRARPRTRRPRSGRRRAPGAGSRVGRFSSVGVVAQREMGLGHADRERPKPSCSILAMSSSACGW